MLPNAPVEHPDVDIIHKDTGPVMHHPAKLDDRLLC
jgi:hypothetical protein